MPLIRALARPLLASMFVVGGVDAIRSPEPKVPAAESVAADVPDKLPVVSNTRQLIQLDGAVKVLAGSLLALGKLPRLSALALAGSLVPTTLSAHRILWEESDPHKRAGQQVHFFKNVSMLGGLILAAVDTAGKPSLAWRAKHGMKDLGTQIQQVAEKVTG